MDYVSSIGNDNIRKPGPMNSAGVSDLPLHLVSHRLVSGEWIVMCHLTLSPDS
jgi:hypothetical protein